MMHTPGPWQVNHTNRYQVCDSDVVNRGCSLIAITVWTDSEHNAKLISAAPDLLAALESAVKTAGGMYLISAKEYEAAINKARGL